jgi:Uri superfamily endonuclease
MTGLQFTIFGKPAHGGTYVLLVHVSKPLELAFGRFQGGRVIAVPEGDYIYIGSALGGKRAGNPLAQRLLRHASRSDGKNHHAIRKSVENLFYDPATSHRNHISTGGKKLHWHIDYLLDCTEAEIDHIIIIQSPRRLEENISGLLGSLEETSLLAYRLGAQDSRRSTHLLKLSSRKNMLLNLRNAIPPLLEP